jgi:general stress protein 26
VFQRLKVGSFAEIQAEFSERVRRIVWCSVATVDTRGRPRSRLLHPIWDRATGWTYPHSLKAKHLAANPHVSLAYVADIDQPVYAACIAAWEENPAEKRRIWDLYRATPPPAGYDPAPIFHSPDHPDFGLLKLTPWRVELYDQGRMQRVWQA